LFGAMVHQRVYDDARHSEKGEAAILHPAIKLYFSL